MQQACTHLSRADSGRSPPPPPASQHTARGSCLSPVSQLQLQANRVPPFLGRKHKVPGALQSCAPGASTNIPAAMLSSRRNNPESPDSSPTPAHHHHIPTALEHPPLPGQPVPVPSHSLKTFLLISDLHETCGCAG